MADSIDQLRVSFVEETRDLINELEDILLSLEVDSLDAETIDHIFRSVHTIKGSGGMLGFEKVLELTHNLEDIYDKVRAGSISFTNELKDISLDTIDVLKILLASDEKIVDSDKIRFSNLCRRIDLYEVELVSVNNKLDKCIKQVADKNTNTYLVDVSPKVKIIKSVSHPRFLIEELSMFGKGLFFAESGGDIELNNIEKCDKNARWRIVISTNEGEFAINNIFELVSDEINLSINVITEGDLLAIDKAYNEIKNLSYKVFELSIDDLKDVAFKYKQLLAEAAEKEIDQNKVEKQDKSSDDSQTKSLSISSIRVSTDKVDQLMNLVSEMVTLQARLNLLAEESNSENLKNIAEKYGVFSKQLRDNAFNISLVPFGVTITRYKRLVHDLSEQLKKKVDFVTDGEDTVLDKKIIEQLSDPIMHILRNCVDHGLEGPSDRKNAGKPEIGTILMKIFHQSNNVIIKISDDGRGLDLNRIKEIGIERKLISADQQVADSDLINLVFLPGFSSAKTISNVSGRGVGLDVVKRNISDIRGSIDISTDFGIGTTFTIKLPLTLSIIDGLQVKIDERDFIIPLVQVDRIESLAKLGNDSVLSQVMTINGEQIPFFDLREEFEIGDVKPDRREIVLVNYNNEKVALIVDSVVGENQTVLKPLGKHYEKQDFFAGGTILGDGSVALVLDINKIVTEFSKK